MMKTPNFARAKKVNAPFHEKVKAGIIGISSGSDHSSSSTDDVTSLSFLLSNFLNENDAVPQSSTTTPNPTDEIKTKPNQINPTVLNFEENDVVKTKLLPEVSNAVRIFSYLNPNKSSIRINVMNFLREIGYNAGICKTKNYEFIDVIISNSTEFEIRYFIDLDFSNEFEIAKQSKDYELQLQSLPCIFIGKNEELRKIVKLMSDAVKRSLKDNGMHLPPWRSNSYMQNKWFGSYKRTTALVTGNVLTTSASSVKCRMSGFDAVKCGGPFQIKI